MGKKFFYSLVENNPMQAANIISQEVGNAKGTIGLHYGSPVFKPPGFLTEDDSLIDKNNFIHSIKSYEGARGNLSLRKTVAKWYKGRLGLSIDPNSEVLITNGSSEALSLTLLAVSNFQDTVVMLDPSYTSFEQCALALDRKVKKIKVFGGLDKHLDALKNNEESRLKACVINSPCNPTGRILSRDEWAAVGQFCKKQNAFLIHDEILDIFTFNEQSYISAASINSLKNSTALINSMSKTFGLPGLRIGWVISNKETISNIASLKAALCLGVNIFSESLAEKVLSNSSTLSWVRENKNEIEKRVNHVCSILTKEKGFLWPFKVQAGFCLFPNVALLYDQLPKKYKVNYLSKGAAVAQYFLDEKNVAVTPGSIYGSEGNDHIKIVVCGNRDELYSAIDRICSIKLLFRN
jgi:phosphonopyruvate decarboxylase